ncbi:MAG: glycosyltransferase [Elusimicrobia bacterium]|nr:glycosyltransferase [Elusimicrobiota bacterium]
MKPLVSVIMPAFNEGRYISEALDSVIGQTFGDWELIVVDDGSTDGTGAVVGSYMAKDSRIAYRRQANRGPAAARNNGLRQAAGEWAAFIDADDMWMAGKLEKQLDVLRGQEDVVSYSPAEYFNENGLLSERKVMFSGQTAQNRREFLKGLLLQPVKLAVTPSVMFRREILYRTGLFDEALRNAEDWDLWIRMAAVCDFRAYPEPLFKRRKHGRSLTSGLEVDVMIKNHKAVLDKYCQSHPADAVLPHRVIYAHHYLDNAYLYRSVRRNVRAVWNLLRAFVNRPELVTMRNLGLLKDALMARVTCWMEEMKKTCEMWVRIVFHIRRDWDL